MKVKFNDSEELLQLSGWFIRNDLVTLISNDISENLNGFILYEDDGETVVKDCSDFVYRWDIYGQKENQISFTNDETFRQKRTDVDDSIPQEIVDPLSNEELTEVVADLMYEVSAAQLGL